MTYRLLLLLFVLLLPASPATAQVNVHVENPAGMERSGEVISIDWEALHRRDATLVPGRVRMVDADGAELPTQVMDAAGDGQPDELLVLVDFEPHQTRMLTVEPERAAPVAPRAHVFHQAERDDLAWENDRIAFRTYGEGLWEMEDLVSSGIDVWTKRTRDLVIDRWYAEGDYHTDTGEGADLFSVGETLGAGGTAVWEDGKMYPAPNFSAYRVLADGPLRAVAELAYDSWEAGGRSVSETRRITIDAGQPVFRVESTFASEDAEALRVVTGLVERDGLGFSTSEEGAWTWLSAWGPLTPDGEHGDLGTAVLLRSDRVAGVIETEDHRLLAADVPSNSSVVYYVGAGWTASGDVDDEEAWAATLDATAERMTHPLRVSFADDSLDVEAVLDQSAERMRRFLDRPAEPDSIPRSLEADGTLDVSPPREWTSGFYPGLLWGLYDYTRDPAFEDAARRWTAVVEGEKRNGGTHDMGFKIYSSFGTGLQITDDPHYRDVVIEAADTLMTRFDPRVGAIKSWDWGSWDYPVIIDNMMNLELLFAAADLTGDSTYYRVADQHARTTLRDHFREDRSSYHVVQYDTLSGAVIERGTHQGYSNASAWSRGQAWGLYGFTMAYRETGNADYLDQAQRIADYILTHPRLPGDLVPYWDYDAPGIPDEPRDASAAAVTASALYELSRYAPEERDGYVRAADRMLASLSQDYLVEEDLDEPFLLDHSTGSVPGGFEVDVPINYADYYYVEALLRRLRLGEPGRDLR